MDAFENVQSNGKIAIKLDDNDALVQVALCEDNDHILLSSKMGKCIRFPLEVLRVFQSRSSSGVRGIKLEPKNEVVSMSILKNCKIEDFEKRDSYLKIPVADRLSIKAELKNSIENGGNFDDVKIPEINVDLLNTLSEKEIKQLALDEEFILTITENGYGKSTSTYEYRTTNRGGIGITNIITSKRNGNVIFSSRVDEDKDVLMMTDKGTVIRTKVKDIRISGRNTQGVTLMRTEDKIISVAVAKTETREEEENNSENEIAADVIKNGENN
jgi:DNA gyrase subunit A